MRVIKTSAIHFLVAIAIFLGIFPGIAKAMAPRFVVVHRFLAAGFVALVAVILRSPFITSPLAYAVDFPDHEKKEAESSQDKGIFLILGQVIIGLIGIILSLIGWALLISIYFAPTIVAIIYDHTNTLAIFILNLFLGWTFIGWVLALVWAVAK